MSSTSTPGAVSQRIKQLEAELGVLLFERAPRGVRLHPETQAYHAAVAEALRLLAEAGAKLTGDLNRAPGQITLHAGASTIAKWLMPRMERFAARFPAVTLVTEVHDTRLTRALGRGEIAIWPGQAPSRHASDRVHCLGEVRLKAVCAPGLARPAGTLSLEALLNLPLLQDAHRRWETLIAQSGSTANARRIVNLGRSALALDAAIAGHGVALAPGFLVQDDLRRERLSEIWQSPEPTEEFYYLLWPRQYARERPLRQIVDWLLAEFAAPPPF